MKPSDFLTPCIQFSRHGTQARIWRDGKGKLLKDMRGGNLDKVRQEWEMQSAVYLSCQLTAKPIELAGHFIIMEDLGESDEITSLEELYNFGEVLLGGLRKAGVLHHDLRVGNIIVKGNQPYALDFGWSRWEKEAFQEDDSLLWLTLHQMWEENNPCPT